MSEEPATRDPRSRQPRARAAHPLPPERAFVVQLSSVAAPGLGRYSGRVEHVVTGRTAHFRSLPQLLAFVRRLLRTGARRRAPTPCGRIAESVTLGGMSTPASSWKRCSTCKKEIPFASLYWVCNVSTCNRTRTALAFCSVPCWDGHVPTLRHRESWAEERRSPTRAEWERQQREAEAKERRRAR